MPALSELKTRRGLLAGASALVTSSCLPSTESSPAPISAPRPVSATPSGPVKVEGSPTPETKGRLWGKEIRIEFNFKLPSETPLPLQESHLDTQLQNPSFVVNENKVYARLANGSIVEIDAKTGNQIPGINFDGILLGSAQNKVLVLRPTDHTIHTIDTATRNITRLADTPETLLKTNQALPKAYYRYPIQIGDGYIALAAPGTHHTYFLDGSKTVEPANDTLVGVAGPLVIGFAKEPYSDPFRPEGKASMRNANEKDPFWNGSVSARPLVTASGLVSFAQYTQSNTSVNFQPYVYSVRENKVLYNQEEPPVEARPRSLFKPVYLNEDVAVFETSSAPDTGPYAYYITPLTTGKPFQPQSSPFPSEFFADSGYLYHSTPQRSEIERFRLSGSQLEKAWKQPVDARCVEFLGLVSSSGKKILLVANWRSKGNRSPFHERPKNEPAKISGIDIESGERLWVYSAPPTLESGRDSDYHPPQTAVVKNKLVVAGMETQQIDIFTGKVESVVGYKNTGNSQDTTPARIVKAVGDTLYIQTRLNLYVLRV